MYPVSVISNGPGNGQRVGNQADLKWFECRFRNYYLDLTAQAPSLTRFIMFRWLEDDNNFAPASSDILVATGGFIAPLSPYNYNHHRINFEVIADHTFKYDPIEKNSDVLIIEHQRLSENRTCFYDTGTNNGTNQVYILLISDVNIPLSIGPYVEGIVRFHYTDQ